MSSLARKLSIEQSSTHQPLIRDHLKCNHQRRYGREHQIKVSCLDWTSLLDMLHIWVRLSTIKMSSRFRSFEFLILLVRPSLGAYFASQPLPLSSRVASDTKWNVYAFPAAISVGLLVLETVYLIINLPETKDYKKSRQAVVEDEARHTETVKESFEIRRNRLKKLGRLHGFFLLFSSGVSRGPTSDSGY
mgnify:CR=1 FL=1